MPPRVGSVNTGWQPVPYERNVTVLTVHCAITGVAAVPAAIRTHVTNGIRRSEVDPALASRRYADGVLDPHPDP